MGFPLTESTCSLSFSAKQPSGSQHQELHLLGQTVSDCWLTCQVMSSQKIPRSQLALGTKHHQALILLQDLTAHKQKVWLEAKKAQPKSYQQML